MSDDPEGSGEFVDEIDTTSGTIEIEDDLLERAHELYPAAATRTELFRRVFERGVCARERDLRERGRNP